MKRLNPLSQSPTRSRLKWMGRVFISKKMNGMHTQKERRLPLAALFLTTRSWTKNAKLLQLNTSSSYSKKSIPPSMRMAISPPSARSRKLKNEQEERELGVRLFKKDLLLVWMPLRKPWSKERRRETPKKTRKSKLL